MTCVTATISFIDTNHTNLDIEGRLDQVRRFGRSSVCRNTCPQDIIVTRNSFFGCWCVCFSSSRCRCRFGCGCCYFVYIVCFSIVKPRVRNQHSLMFVMKPSASFSIVEESWNQGNFGRKEGICGSAAAPWQKLLIAVLYKQLSNQIWIYFPTLLYIPICYPRTLSIFPHETGRVRLTLCFTFHASFDHILHHLQRLRAIISVCTHCHVCRFKLHRKVRKPVCSFSTCTFNWSRHMLHQKIKKGWLKTIIF